MIKQDEKIKNLSPMIAEFGTGDIGVATTVYPDKYGMIFYNKEPARVGSKDKNIKAVTKIKDINPEIIFKFNSHKSVKVIIKCLLKLYWFLFWGKHKAGKEYQRCLKKYREDR
jgi:hypothetical protein